MRALIALVLAVFCAVTAMPASAQQSAGTFVVAGVPADATAANATEARSQAMASAQQIGFERLVRRLTPEGSTVPAVTPQQLDTLVASVDIENERRSATRYNARVTLRFNAANVRTVLRGAGLAITETRTSPVLIVPQAPGASPETAALWRAVWAEGGYGEELVPLVVAPAGIDGAPDWAAAESAAQAGAAATALFATLRVSGQTASAALVEVGPSGTRRDRGTVQARLGADQRAGFAQLADQVSRQLQNEWKARAGTGGQRSRVSASALYEQQAQWQRIKAGLEAAASTLISEIRIEAVGRNGALVSFSYAGDQPGLVAELRRHGVSLENAEMGPVLRLAR